MPDLIHCVGIYVTPAINKQYFRGGATRSLKIRSQFYG